MPLNIPNLDDRTYADLVDEAIAMVPRYASGWTDHNPSDPGITLIELLAYFTELLIYQLNRVTKETKIRFLQLLLGSNGDAKARWTQASSAEVDEALRQAVLGLRRRHRAVTCEDYEYLAREATEGKTESVLRARAFVGRDLRTTDDASRDATTPGHVSLVVLPASDLGQDRLDGLLAQVRDFFEPRRLLTTRLHVVKPFYLWVALGATIHPQPNVPERMRTEIRQKAIEKLQQYFSPWPGGGPRGEGWPFGRALYLSEVYDVLDHVEDVDYVEDVHVVRMSIREEPKDDRTKIGVQFALTSVGIDSRLGAEVETGSGRLLRDGSGRLAVISLRPYELIRIASSVEDFKISDSRNTGDSITQGTGQ